MAKRHKIHPDKLVKIPAYLTPMQPMRGEFTRFTTAAPVDLWNIPTLRAVASHCLCPVTKAKAQTELESRS